MKTYTRAASLLGVLLLSGALAACGNESEPASQTEPAGTAATSGQDSIEEPATAPAGEAAADDKTAAADTKEEAPSGDKASGDSAADDKTASGDSADDKKAEAAASGAADSKNTDSKGGASSGAGAAAADIKPADKAKQGKKGEGADRPKTESFEVAGASSTDSVTGKLQEGYGYAFYAMEGLKFDAEKNLLTMADNPDYYATVTPLAKGYGLAGLRKEGQTALKDYGKASELKGANIPAALSASRLFMSAEGDNGTGQFGLWETQNKGYQVQIHMPSGTESKTFGPLVYASISTLAD
ncbi:hypothetical protein [Saccharibacillus deserti]|uniref:hypothetical protein n=1 Tax=Saccharibacillus deserti TaxID=1634444 RepID=UPI0015576BE7|nr:hypothetical protein [Saccharibacillus deserti]